MAARQAYHYKNTQAHVGAVSVTDVDRGGGEGMRTVSQVDTNYVRKHSIQSCRIFTLHREGNS